MSDNLNHLILIYSHRLSGSHFLIDSLRANIPNANFLTHFNFPADFNIGSLYSKSDIVYDTFKRLLELNCTLIIKSHLLLREMNIENPRDKYEDLIKNVYVNSNKIYIHRNGMDTLSSLFHFQKNTQNKSIFINFLKSKNDHIVKYRPAQGFDDNKVKYWAYHVTSFLNNKAFYKVSFESLKTNFISTMGSILKENDLSIPNSLVKPKVPTHRTIHMAKLFLARKGLIPLPQSSSVRPRTGKIGASKEFFKENSKILDQTKF